MSLTAVPTKKYVLFLSAMECEYTVEPRYDTVYHDIVYAERGNDKCRADIRFELTKDPCPCKWVTDCLVLMLCTKSYYIEVLL